ncbi:MAG TPA: pyridoxamine 5'-phosphate oxidase family protein [Acidimicrobiia bacterium]|jgi:nitroimidazol reductase NimA-like FMN-containing flavoprotein (pyridoxamine 5'-phosphate oxidase superfamily)|nr:pyridoxamine 5'-phosphate oxidase family protein [Acidimicrobiia bacterium]
MDTLTQDQCQALLEQAHVAHIGVITEEGPYVTPISYVFLGNKLAFRTAPGRRTEALEIDRRVSVEVSTYDPDTGDWSSVIVTGTAAVIRNDAAKEGVVVDALFEKYRDAFKNLLSSPPGNEPITRFIVVIDVHEMSGRRSGGYVTAKTRPGRL